MKVKNEVKEANAKAKPGSRGIKLTPQQKGRIFKDLLHKTLLEVGVQHNLHAYFNSDATVRGYVSRIFKEVAANPSLYGVSEDLANAVKQGVENRKVAGASLTAKMEKGEVLDQNDVKSVVVGGRNKVAMMIHRKLDRINSSKKMLDQTNLATLGTLFGIFFDKAQIIQGQATEHIAVLAKGIPDGMTPEESLEALLKMREADQVEKHEEPAKSS